MLRYTDIEPCSLGSGLLELERAVSPKQENVCKRLRKSASAQGFVIIIQALSVTVLLSLLFLQSRELSDVSMELQRQRDITLLPAMMPVPQVHPHKYAVQHVTPAQFQWNRGTCWDFTIIAVLEHSYRVNGIEQGWLRPDEYVQFSQQALGATLMQYCRDGHAKFCMSPGDDLWTGNSTEGAEAQLLYYVKELQNKIMPHSVCPYTKLPGRDGKCPGLKAAYKGNPLNFWVRSMSTSYDRFQVKKHLHKHGHAMALAATIVGARFYLPCLPEFTKNPGMYQDECHKQCVQCPADHAYHEFACCAMIERPGYNMEGEFFANDPSLDGGHAMTLVGWNDIFRTSVGDVGGWILKNSWWDGKSGDTSVWKHARGSHSIGYFMLEISDTDERAICPNSYNPRNWYPCAGQNGVKQAGNGVGISPSHYAFDSMVSICTAEETKRKAQEQRRVLTLVCHDSKYCSVEAGSRLFLINATNIAGGLHKMCFLQSMRSGPLSEFCLPPFLIDDVAMFITPAKEEIKENDRDMCGFYFFPYSLIESTSSMIGASTYDVQGFDIQWSPSSYERGGNQKDFDYKLLESSTHVQKTRSFSGDLPNQNEPQ